MSRTEFIDLAPEDFPFRLEFFKESTGEVVWAANIEEPGAVDIPPLGEMYGVKIGSRMTFSDGTSWSSDDPEPEA